MQRLSNTRNIKVVIRDEIDLQSLSALNLQTLSHTADPDTKESSLKRTMRSLHPLSNLHNVIPTPPERLDAIETPVQRQENNQKRPFKANQNSRK